MDDEQFRQMMETLDAGNAHLRSIRAWVQILGGLALLGVFLGIASGWAAIAGS